MDLRPKPRFGRGKNLRRATWQGPSHSPLPSRRLQDNGSASEACDEDRNAHLKQHQVVSDETGNKTKRGTPDGQHAQAQLVAQQWRLVPARV